MSSPVKEATLLLKGVLKKSNIDVGHGLQHATKVFEHSRQALKHVSFDKDIKLAIKLASLLHDADDRKFFPSGSNNAEQILHQVIPDSEDTRQLALKMISLVSCSKNGLELIEQDKEWLYYPRWSDRLEALGKGGILRAYQYSIFRKRPLDSKATPKTNSPVLLYGMIATPRRFQKYMEVKESATFMDHFYDKVLHLRHGFQTTNPYYLDECQKRHQIIEDFVLEYCVNPDIEFLVNKYCF